VTRALVPSLRANLVNVASELALIGQPGYTAYSATKGAIIALSRALAADPVAARAGEIAMVPMGRLGVPRGRWMAGKPRAKRCLQWNEKMDKATQYRELNTQLAELFADETNGLANAANLCAVLYHELPDLNWVGFYFLQGDELVLGPFQGRVACVRIALGRGVCGAAAQRRETLVVPNVDEFPGHIACDTASRSEIVVPPTLPRFQ